MAKKQSKSLETFIKSRGVSRGTYDVLRLLGETGARPISDWEKIAHLANTKPPKMPWSEWKEKKMNVAEKRTEQRKKSYVPDEDEKTEQTD